MVLRYDTSNGIHVQSEGGIKNPGTEQEALSSKGEYSFTAPNGVIYKVVYTADENGFIPKLYETY